MTMTFHCLLDGICNIASTSVDCKDKFGRTLFVRCISCVWLIVLLTVNVAVNVLDVMRARW